MSHGVRITRASLAKNLPSNKQLRTWAEAVLSHCHRPRASLSVRIVGAAESARLNARYRGQRAPTNVLSFPCDLPLPDGAPWLGDIVVCAPVVAREARRQDKPLAAHWAHMVVHGVLHLLGHDHRRPRQAARMERLEQRLLAEFGFPDPYL